MSASAANRWDIGVRRQRRDVRHVPGRTYRWWAFALSLLAHAGMLALLLTVLAHKAGIADAPSDHAVQLVFEPESTLPTPAVPVAEPKAPVVAPPAVAPLVPVMPEPNPTPAAAVADDLIPVPPVPPPAPRRVTRSPSAVSRPNAPAVAESKEPALEQAPAAAVAAPLIPARPVAGMATDRPPAYPELARRRDEQGRVVVRVDVSPDGAPTAVSVAEGSGHASLDSAALAAVRAWRFVPASRGGRPIAAIALVPINFRLAD